MSARPSPLKSPSRLLLVPSWVTVKVWPAIVMVPVRGGPEFGATLKDTVESPVPVEAPVSAIHGTLLAALQAQFPMTDVEPDPPASEKVCAAGKMPYSSHSIA